MTGIYRAVLWDVDGTLVDSEGLHYEALEAVGREAGYRMSAALMERFTGLTMEAVWDMLVREAGLGLAYAPWIAAITRHYAKHIQKAPLRAGAAEALSAVAALGIPQAAVSNATRGIVEANLSRLPDPGWLRFGISREDVAAGKPDPAPYREAARRLGLAPSACVAVEDSQTGARAAAAAGAYTLFWPAAGAAAPGFVSRTIAEIGEVDWCDLLKGARA